MRSASNMADLINGLKNGKGIPYLLQKAYAILENPILMHDMEYKVIAHNENVVTDDPIWIEYATNGTVGADWLDFFKNECFIETAANAKTITFLTSDKLQYNRIFGKLFNKNNIQIGCACMVACNKPFEEEDSLLFEEICAVFSKEFGKNQYYTDYGQAYLEKLLAELIAGISDKDLYTAHVESIYMHLQTNLYFAVADIGEATSDAAKLAQCRDAFRKTQPEYTYAVYDKYVLIIISIDDSQLYVEKHLKQLYRLFRKNMIRVGISSCFDNLFELPRYYKEACKALQAGLENAAQGVFLYEQLSGTAHD